MATKPHIRIKKPRRRRSPSFAKLKFRDYCSNVGKPEIVYQKVEFSSVEMEGVLTVVHPDPDEVRKVRYVEPHEKFVKVKTPACCCKKHGCK